MDSTSVGGALQEPEAPEVMFEVFPPAWDMGWEGGGSSWGCWGRGATQHGP